MAKQDHTVDSTGTVAPTDLERAWPFVRQGLVAAGVAFWLLLGAIAALITVGPTTIVTLATVLLLLGGALVTVLAPVLSYVLGG